MLYDYEIYALHKRELQASIVKIVRDLYAKEVYEYEFVFNKMFRNE